MREGLLGIRTSVWLIVLGAALVGGLTVCLSPRYAGPSAPVSARESLPHPEPTEPGAHEASLPKSRGIVFTPAAGESESSSDFDEALLTMTGQLMEDRRTWCDEPHFPYFR
jgi:hypothetical protein